MNSTQPQDVLALGRQLVDELGLERGVDTLGRWMTHHVAELISRAEIDPDEAERERAKERAIDTILRIWSHRSTINRLNPLADLEPALVALRTFTLGVPSWVSLRQGTSLETSTARVHELLRRLVINVLLLRLGGTEAAQSAIERAQRTGEWQSDEEQEVISHLMLWIAPDVRRRQGGEQESWSESKDSTPTEDLGEAEIPINDEVQVEVSHPEVDPSPSGNLGNAALGDRNKREEHLDDSAPHPQGRLPSVDLRETMRTVIDALEAELPRLRTALHEGASDTTPHDHDLAANGVQVSDLSECCSADVSDAP